MPLSEAVELFKDWHQFDPAGVMDINIPEPKGQLRFRGYIKRLDYLSDKWNQYEDVYYYHHFRKNFPALYEDEKGNYFVYGFIRVTKRGIDDWKIVNNLVWKRPDAKKGVAKLGVLQLVSFEDIDTGKTETLMFDDRYYVGHPDLDFTYISSPVRANPSAPPLAVQHLLSVVENIKKDKKAMKALDRALSYHRKQMKPRARANLSVVPAAVLTKMMTSQAFLKSIVTEVSTATFGVGIIATILGGLLVDWLVSTARNKAIPPQMPMPSSWVTRMTKSYVEGGIKDPKDIQTRLEEIWKHLDFDQKREAYERDYKWPGKEKLQVTENPKEFTEAQLVQKAYEITFRWAYANKIHSSAEAFSFFRKRGINVSFVAIGSAFDSGKTKRIKEEQARENPESEKCPKCGGEGWLDVSGKYVCVKCGHAFTVERDPLASRFNPAENPLKSKSQWRLFKARYPEMFNDWQRHAPVNYQDLPERAEENPKDDTLKFFVYGTLRIGGPLASLFYGQGRMSRTVPTFVSATAQGEIRDTGDFPGAHFGGTGTIIGDLVTFTMVDPELILGRMDHLEMVQQGVYKRVKIKARLEDGTEEEAWAYEWTCPSSPWETLKEIPGGDYLKYLEKKWASPSERRRVDDYEDDGGDEDYAENPILGMVGKHDHVSRKRFDQKELDMGVEIEKEHTDDLKVALEIAKDHLAEIPDYYTRLTAMEKAAEGSRKNPVETVLGDGPGEGR